MALVGSTKYKGGRIDKHTRSSDVYDSDVIYRVYHGKDMLAEVKDEVVGKRLLDKFSNGRIRAMQTINQKMVKAGLRVENIGTLPDLEYTVKDAVSGKQLEIFKATTDAEAIKKVRDKYGKRTDYMQEGHVQLLQGKNRIYL